MSYNITAAKLKSLLKLIPKTSQWMLLVTSIILLSMGIYGTIVSSEYGCDKGIFIKPKYLLPPQTLPPAVQNEFLHCLDISSLDELKAPILKDFDKIGRCLNDNLHNDAKCMEGGLMTLSIISIVIGSLMLLAAGYLLIGENYLN